MIGIRKLLAACVAAMLGVTVPASVTIWPWRVVAARAVRPGTAYLSLGDSVTYGLRELTSVPRPNWSIPSSSVGYPEDVAAELALAVTNPSCSGETSSSLISVTLPSNGCEGGFRPNFPLKVTYANSSQSQLDYAVNFLQHRHPVTLVSLMIGVNDLLRLCQKATSADCAKDLPTVLPTVQANIQTILGRIRNVAKYHGQIVIENYYALPPIDDATIQKLNLAIDTAAMPFQVRIADGDGAFKNAAVSTNGNLCAAGLLTVITPSSCGQHPSVTGQEMLAGALERVIQKA